jgi:hypothetical protein
LKPYWVSWYAVPDTDILLTSPWWRHLGASRRAGRDVCVAAIMAISPRDAANKLMHFHDHDVEEPFSVRLRYIREMPYGWTPFGRKRHQADWMVWGSKPH